MHSVSYCIDVSKYTVVRKVTMKNSTDTLLDRLKHSSIFPYINVLESFIFSRRYHLVSKNLLIDCPLRHGW